MLSCLVIIHENGCVSTVRQSRRFATNSKQALHLHVAEFDFIFHSKCRSRSFRIFEWLTVNHSIVLPLDQLMFKRDTRHGGNQSWNRSENINSDSIEWNTSQNVQLVGNSKCETFLARNAWQRTRLCLHRQSPYEEGHKSFKNQQRHTYFWNRGDFV